MSDWSPAVGDRVAGRYEIESFVGEGGFATVWRARDDSGRPVVLKHPNYDSNNDRSVVDKYFAKEVSALERIREAGGHPNVMTLHEVLEVAGTTVLVVDHVEGRELKEVVEASGPLTDWERVRRVGIALSDAVAFLHEAEIIYRDLKPENVMLKGDVPTLIDFNTATGTDDRSGTSILGPFKPVEVAEAGRVETRQGPWSDVYSVGKVLVYMMRGSVPEVDGVDPRDFGVAPPAYLAETVERSTAKDPEDRYRNATVLRRVLEDRSPEPPAQARLEHVGSGERFTVGPGDTIGRKGAEGPVPAIAIDDPKGDYVSAVQASFERRDGSWVLRDRSLNGTYVRRGDAEWQRVLCEEGYERLRREGVDPTGPDGSPPPDSVVVEPGDLIALVDPGYGVTFEFQE